jgi:hypothetical protein
MAFVVFAYAVVTLAISYQFLRYRNSQCVQWNTIGFQWHWLLAYVCGIVLWTIILVPTNIILLILQFVYQVRTTMHLQAIGSLKPLSLVLLSIAFVILGILQFCRSWCFFSELTTQHATTLKFVDELATFIARINIQSAYLSTGIGFIVLLWIVGQQGP